MLSSGMSLDRSVQTLVALYPKNRVLANLNDVLHSNGRITEFMAVLFPWWCSYPYSTYHVPLDTNIFFETCLNYIQERKQLMQRILHSLIYPLFLFLFSLLLFYFAFHTLPSLDQSETYYRYGLYFIFCLSLISGLSFIAFMTFILRFGVYDILFLLKLNFDQGISLNHIFSLFVFPNAIQSRWSKLPEKVVEQQSFVVVFCWLFKCPDIIKEVLLGYETAGKLRQGMDCILPLYKSYFLNRIFFMVNFFKFIIYFIIVCLILLIIALVYQPLLSFTL